MASVGPQPGILPQIDLQFEVVLEWKDQRITYNNLKKDFAFNALTGVEMNSIWLPVLIYVNTDQKETTRLGENWEWSTIVVVSRDGAFTRQVSGQILFGNHI